MHVVSPMWLFTILPLSRLQCRLEDDSVFPPIAAMLKKCRENPSMRGMLDEEEIAQTRGNQKIPPHAQLPEDECPELPVHNASDMCVDQHNLQFHHIPLFYCSERNTIIT